MKKTTQILIGIFLTGFIVFISSEIYCQESYSKVVKANKIWETEDVFQIPESVFYDDDNNVLYVSNIDGNPLVKDNNGFISRVSLDGEILDLKWITGIDAPKGMGKYGNKLYVSNIDQLVEIDISSGDILNRYIAEDAQFLNDITVDEAGNIYISDMNQKRIYRFKNGKLDTWLEDDILLYVNGLHYENGNLYAGTRNGIIKIDPKTKEFRLLVEVSGGIDGLEGNGGQEFIISDFNGKVQYIVPGSDPIVLFNTTDMMINAADIRYIPQEWLLFVPTFSDNRVMAYEIVME